MKINFILQDGIKGKFTITTFIHDDKGNAIHHERFSLSRKQTDIMLPAFIMHNYGDLFANENISLANSTTAINGEQAQLKEFCEKLIETHPNITKDENPLKHKSKKQIEPLSFDYTSKLHHSIMTKEKALVINDFNIKSEKKRGLIFTKYENGRAVSSNSVLRNGGISADNETYEEFIRKNLDVDEGYHVLFQTKGSPDGFFRRRQFENVLHEKKCQDIDIIGTNISFKQYKIKNAEKNLLEYSNRLEEELRKPEHNVVYVDGSHRSDFSASGYILDHNNKVKTKTMILGTHGNYEELSVLIALNDILKDENLSKNKTHFICDYDKLEVLKVNLDKPLNDINSTDELYKSPLFKDVQKLYKEKKNKVYFHFLKSHSAIDTLSKKGNDLIDEILRNTINQYKDIFEKQIVHSEYDLELLKAQTFENFELEIVEKKLNEYKDTTESKRTGLNAKKTKKKKKNASKISENFNLEEHIYPLENFKSQIKIFINHREKTGDFVVDVENKCKFTAQRNKNQHFFKQIPALAKAHGKKIQIIATKEALEQVQKTITNEEKGVLALASEVKVLLVNSEKALNKETQERRMYANQKKLSSIYGRRHLKQMKIAKQELESKISNLIESVNSKIESPEQATKTIENVEMKKEKSFEQKRLENMKFDFDNAYGNQDLFPRTHELPEEQNFIFVKYGNKTMNIHKFENGEHIMERFSQEEEAVEALNTFLQKNPIQDNSKNLLLSMPNGFGLRGLGDFIRGEKHQECIEVKKLIGGKKKENIFITKTNDFMFPLIENNVKWYVEKMIDVPKEKQKRQKKVRP